VPALLAVLLLLGSSLVSPIDVAPVIRSAAPVVEPAELPPPSPSPVPSTTAVPPEPVPPARDPKPPCGPASAESIERWIGQASAALVWHGEAPIVDWEAVRLIIAHESSGNPCAFNDWDSNWYAGTPSKGLIQAIDPTFARWHLPGYPDTYHPVDSIIAGVRYARGRYGSESYVPGVVAVRGERRYVGY
jgi:hypothetical protein